MEEYNYETAMYNFVELRSSDEDLFEDKNLHHVPSSPYCLRSNSFYAFNCDFTAADGQVSIISLILAVKKVGFKSSEIKG